MANSDKNILIVPNTNQNGLPNIQFVGSSSAPISLNVLDDNTVSFSGSQGQLFSINNNLTSGTIFSVNDVSGIPSIEVDASGTISLARFGGNIGIGKGSPNAKLDITGSTVISGNLTVIGTISGTSYQGVSGGGGTPGGTNTTVQFNSGSTFSGSSNLVWDYTNNILKVNGQFTSVGSGNSLQFWKDSTPTKAINLGMSAPGGGPITNDAIFSAYDGTTWSERLRITNDGKVGIGTTSPQVTTEIVKGTQLTKVSNDTVLFVSNNTSPTTYIEIANTTTGASGIAFTRGNGTGNAGAIDYSNASNKMTFYTADSARAVIDTNGNVGIGTTSPSFKADIRGNTTADLYVGTSDTTAVYLSASNTGTGGYTLIVAADGSGAKIRTNSSARDLQLGTNSTTALTIDTSQRVGIGTTNPGTKLQVIGDAAVGNPDTTSIYLTASNGGGYSLVLSADSTGAKVETNVSSRDLRLGTNSITALTIDTSQRVGIGTTSPNAKLDVNGNTIISGTLTVTGSIFVSGSSIYGQVAELTSSTTNYTLVRQDSGKFLNINSGSAVTVTVPTGLPTGFTVSLCQLGAGQVTVSGAVGVTINNRQSHTKTAGQYAVVSLVGTSADTYVFVGDTTA